MVFLIQLTPLASFQQSFLVGVDMFVGTAMGIVQLWLDPGFVDTKGEKLTFVIV